MRVGLAYHEKFCQYDLGPRHPFRGDRFVNAMRLFEEKGLLGLPNMVMLEPKPATTRDLLRVHDKTYLSLICKLAERSMPYDIETPVSPKIHEAILLIVGGAITAGKAIYEGKIDRGIALGCGFHHAGKDYGGGFCLFNDVAVLAEYLRESFDVDRVLILDYDLHAGNGTSDIYYSDPDVLFISFHQDPRTLYPGTGFIEQVGDDEGKGYNVNVPLPPWTSDQTYLYALREIFVPLAGEFKPEIILANGGSDAHFADTLGSLSLTCEGFFQLSRTIAKVSDKVCNGKLVLMVGSGYNPDVLPLCWYALAAGIIGLDEIDVHEPSVPSSEPEENRKTVENTLASLREVLKTTWRCFR